MIVEGFLTALILIFLSELGDKTMLVSVIFSAKVGRSFMVLFVVVLALASVTIIGVSIGFVLFEFIPIIYLRYASAGVFFIIGFYYLFKTPEEVKDSDSYVNSSLLSLFSIVFIAEFGDKTQLSVISLTISTLDPVGVFIGALIGFIIVNSLAVIFGKVISERVSLKVFQKVAAVLFLVFGFLIIFGIF